LNEKLKSTRGVSAVSFLSGAAPLQNEDDRFFWIEGEPTPAGNSDMHMSLFYVVEPDYLTVMGIPLKQGRFFTEQDDERATRVAVIDEALARKYFGTADPIGKRINLKDDQGPYQIVGVAGHVKQWSLDSDDKESLQSQLYLPFRALPDNQLSGATNAGVVVRCEGDPAQMFSAIRHAVHSQNSQNVVSGMQTMNEVIAASLAERRFSMILLGSFAVVALVLASLGIYGVISYLVGQRTHELGIRLALGANRSDILRLILGHGLKLALIGVGLGLLVALGLTRLIATMLYGVGATDPATFAIVGMLLTLVALLACYLPARRATRVDPLVALRSE